MAGRGVRGGPSTGISERQACKLLDVDRASIDTRPGRIATLELRQQLVAAGAAEATLRIPAVVAHADKEPTGSSA